MSALHILMKTLSGSEEPQVILSVLFHLSSYTSASSSYSKQLSTLKKVKFSWQRCLKISPVQKSLTRYAYTG